MTPPVFEAQLAAVQCREDAVSVETLREQGWEVASEPTPWGSVWMTRPVRDEEESRG